MKRFVTMIELLIAMALTMIVLSTLAYFYWQVEEVNILSDRDQQTAFEKLYLHCRLSGAIPKTVAPNSDDFCFVSGHETDFLSSGTTANLLFTFDNGVRLDPPFSNHVLARLFVDEKHRLCLCVWPSPKKWDPQRLPPAKPEILLENVSSLEFEFYLPPAKDWTRVWEKAKIKVKNSENFAMPVGGEWRPEWSAEWPTLPAMVRVKIGRDRAEGRELMVFTYPLVRSPYFIYVDR